MFSSTHVDEVAAVAGVVEDEDRRPLHAVAHHRAGDAAREVEHLHAAVVGGDQRALGGGQRDDELPLGVLAVDLERAGEADRHLGDAGEVLDVALGDGGVEGELVDVLELDARVLLDELLARLDDLRACSRCPCRGGRSVRLTFSAMASLTLKESEPKGSVSKARAISCCPLSSWSRPGVDVDDPGQREGERRWSG